jgi:hypothetical protein
MFARSSCGGEALGGLKNLAGSADFAPAATKQTASAIMMVRFAVDDSIQLVRDKDLFP